MFDNKVKMITKPALNLFYLVLFKISEYLSFLWLLLLTREIVEEFNLKSDQQNLIADQ